ncbi:MAG: dihydrolipoyllysine-residue succinyltransferase component of 2-oxoglutarate dehydrogenase complex [Candidatus Binatia bacterium]|nr:MAG: dihydrolipoyllysine-residue succinyltransferase component of 2-oxoglutarate dehydrogenase complex [Candidatus Binatia bacterium]
MEAVEVRVPPLGESITEAVIVRWLKEHGAEVRADEILVELETEKANVEIPAEREGVLEILRQEGETVRVGDVVARIAPAGERRAPQGAPAKPASESKPARPAERREVPQETPGTGTAKETPAAKPPERSTTAPAAKVTPLARRVAAEHGVDAARISGSGPGGRVTKSDVLARVPTPSGAEVGEEGRVRRVPTPSAEGEAEEERVPMTPIRRRIAERLLAARRETATLTTFNEVDMSAVNELRRRYREAFERKHGIRLGLLSFFARSCIAALREIPVLNAQIDGADVVYKKHVHLGIAVSTPRGLVVPVVRYADRLSFAELETEIARLAARAREGKLSVDEVTGGTFTITNGGVFGSLLSTPLLNPPQSGILGMHKIQERPVVVDGQIAVRPMMYVALSYDHRLVDGEQAVTFLVRVKERLEDPARLLLDL